MKISVRSDSQAQLLTIGTASGFVLVLGGSNALTPLLPHYQDAHDLGAFASAAIFSTYFLALMTVLLISVRTSFVRYARKILPAALVVGVVSDIGLIAGDTFQLVLYPARFLSGTSVALSTGAAAAVMVAVRGERGRAFIGSGSFIGAGGGLAVSIGIVVFLPAPAVTVYVLHAAMLLICLILLLAGLRRAPNVLALAAGPAPALPPPPVRPPPRERIGAHLLGAVAWAVGALAVGVLPVALLDRGVTDSLLIALCLSGSCLWASMVAGLAGLGSRWRFTATQSAILFCVGWTVTTVGLVLAWPVPVLIGCVVGGIGQAPAYRVGLALLTRRLDPVRQGQVASGYSAASYAGAGVFVLGAGISVACFGTVNGMVVIGVIFVVSALGAALTIRPPRNSYKTADISLALDEYPAQRALSSTVNRLN